MIIRNIEALLPDYLPDFLPHRDHEIDTVIFSLKPLTKGSRASNLILLGPPGSGKTATVKFVSEKLEEEVERVRVLYLNCWEQSTRSAILSAIVNFLGYPVPRRGLAIDEIYSKLQEFLNKTSFFPVLILDEVDQIKELSKLLYDLLRLPSKKPLTLILITNNPSFLLTLDPRVKSSLREERIFFNPYSFSQLRDILRERADLALEKNSLAEEVLDELAYHAEKNHGDSRLAIEALLKAARLAEKEGSRKITKKHITKILEDAETYKFKEKVVFLSPQEKIILKALTKPMTSGSLFKAYKKLARKEAITERHFRNFINSLEERGFLKTQKLELKARGKTRKIQPKISQNIFNKIMKNL